MSTPPPSVPPVPSKVYNPSDFPTNDSVSGIGTFTDLIVPGYVQIGGYCVARGGFTGSLNGNALTATTAVTATNLKTGSGTVGYVLTCTTTDGVGAWAALPVTTTVLAGTNIVVSGGPTYTVSTTSTPTFTTVQVTTGNGTSGYVLTASDTSGTGSWAALPTAPTITAGTNISVSGGPAYTIATTSTPTFTTVKVSTGNGTAGYVLTASDTVGTGSWAALPTTPTLTAGTNITVSGGPTYTVSTSSTPSFTNVKIGTSGFVSGYVLTSDASGVGTWQSLPTASGVTSLSGNSDIICSSSTGAVSLSLAQSIQTTSNVTFNNISANGGFYGTIMNPAQTGIQSIGSLVTGLLPVTNNGVNAYLGDASYNWLYAYITTVNTSTINNSSNSISTNSTLLPNTTNTYNLGGSSNYWNTLYVQSISLSNNRLITASQVQFTNSSYGGCIYPYSSNTIAFKWTSTQLQYVIDNVNFQTIAITSDSSLKINVTAASPVLATIDTIQFYKYQYDYITYPSVFDQTVYTGLTAQSILGVAGFEGVVQQGTTLLNPNTKQYQTYYTVDGQRLAMIAVKAIKELHAIVNAIQAVLTKNNIS